MSHSSVLKIPSTAVFRRLRVLDFFCCNSLPFTANYNRTIYYPLLMLIGQEAIVFFSPAIINVHAAKIRTNSPILILQQLQIYVQNKKPTGIFAFFRLKKPKPT